MAYPLQVGSSAGVDHYSPVTLSDYQLQLSGSGLRDLCKYTWKKMLEAPRTEQSTAEIPTNTFKARCMHHFLHLAWTKLSHQSLLHLGFPGPATGVIWALRAQSWKKSRKMSSRGLSAPRPQKSQTESKKSRKTVDFDSFSTRFSTFCAPGPRGPGNSFSDSFSNFGPGGPKRPL